MGQSSVGESVFDYIDGLLNRKFSKLLSGESSSENLCHLLRNDGVEILGRDAGSVFLRGNLSSLLSANRILNNFTDASSTDLTSTGSLAQPQKLAASSDDVSSTSPASARSRRVSPRKAKKNVRNRQKEVQVNLPQPNPRPDNGIHLESFHVHDELNCEGDKHMFGLNESADKTVVGGSAATLLDGENELITEICTENPALKTHRRAGRISAKTPEFNSQTNLNVSSSSLLDIEYQDFQVSEIPEFKFLPLINVTITEPKDPEDLLSEALTKYADVQRICPEEKRMYGFHKQRGENTRSKFYELVTGFKYACDLCSFQTKRKSHLQKHKEMHKDNPVVFTCPEPNCGYKCIRNGDLTRHRVSTHSSGNQVLYRCEHCPYRTPEERSFLRHTRNRHQNKEPDGLEEELYKCLLCEYKTMKTKFFIRHLKKHDVHLGKDDAEKPSKPSRFNCDLCEYSSKKPEHLKRHKNSVHTTDRKFICDLCGLSFKRKDFLKDHLQLHSGKSHNRPFLCDVCPKSYKNSYSLNEHKASHENRREMKCDRCDKSFNTKDVLQKHLRRVHHVGRYRESTVSKAKEESKESFIRQEDMMVSHSYSTFTVDDEDIVDQKEFLNGQVVMETTTIPLNIMVEQSLPDN